MPLAPLASILRADGGRRIAWWESLLVLLGASCVAFFRLGREALDGKVWAEDGSTFLHWALHSNVLTGTFEPYAGYGHLLPRLQAETLSWLPVTWYGLALNLTAAATQGAVALLAYHVVNSRSSFRATPVFAALAVVAVPVGSEVVDSIANDQWFLLIGGTLAPLWAPRRLPGKLLSVVTIAAVAGSCPFGFLCVAIGVAVWLVSRDRAALVVAAAGLAGGLFQLVVIVTSPPRGPTPSSPDSDLVAGYLRRVLGDGVLGTWRHDDPLSTSVVAGCGVLLLMVAATVHVARRGRGAALVVPALLVGVSVVLYAAPILISHAPTNHTLMSGRYAVAPVALLLIAVALVADASVPTGGFSLPDLGAVAAGVLVVAALFAMVSSWQVPSEDPRRSAPGWQEQIEIARDRCEGRPEGTVQNIEISPPGWLVPLTCRELR
ncbi:hypothetical protein [Nocardioides sp. W7]|uniref:hypothetical protein n=1 Tax=Nocardioides sp. W7 TaxID=2931390 RepID=UPI001FD06E00|nr:hypothetical protein [Nocardioides sp. W7]